MCCSGHRRRAIESRPARLDSRLRTNRPDVRRARKGNGLRRDRRRAWVGAVQKEGATLFDTVIEAVGKPETWAAAVQLVRKGGLVNLFGGCPSRTNVALHTARVHYSSLIIVSSFHHTPRAIRRALEFIEKGVVRADDFVDGEWRLTQLPELFRIMASGNHAVKTLVRVQD
ncbi:MAG: hypothetical protein DME26_17840 [Verrucomicrobia bacterium]|nr:MAG: hypothetical protein DME26_17840 [Verrucomicrobiota bacterium]